MTLSTLRTAALNALGWRDASDPDDVSPNLGDLACVLLAVLAFLAFGALLVMR